MQKKRQPIEWRYVCETEDTGKDTPIWSVQALANETLIAEGRGNTKKAAQHEAAREALVKLERDIVSLCSRRLNA